MAEVEGEVKELPLKEFHKALGAKFVPFAGWNMPVQYSGLALEHEAVRTGVGIFDVSHMGQLMLEGPGTLDLLQLISTNDVSKLVDGKAQYGLMLNKQGGVVDDIIVYRLSDLKYFVCVNASNTETDYNWFLKNKGDFDCKIENLSGQYMQFAIQGPLAMGFLAEVFGDDAREVKRFAFKILAKYSNASIPCIMARTGYSGEDGVEIFVPMERGEELWAELFQVAEQTGTKLVPCGLGARDTLRMEANLPLHGHEIKEDITPLSAGLERFISFEKGPFVGSLALSKQKELGVTPVLIGLEVEGPGIIRGDYSILSGGRTVGWVCSGTKTPTVNKAIGIALVLKEFSDGTKPLTVKVRDKELPVKKVPLPFYKRSK